jgi:hypothetical protein
MNGYYVCYDWDGHFLTFTFTFLLTHIHLMTGKSHTHSNLFSLPMKQDVIRRGKDEESVHAFKQADPFADPKRLYRHASKSSSASDAAAAGASLDERISIRTTLLEYG